MDAQGYDRLTPTSGIMIINPTRLYPGQKCTTRTGLRAQFMGSYPSTRPYLAKLSGASSRASSHAVLETGYRGEEYVPAVSTSRRDEEKLMVSSVYHYISIRPVHSVQANGYDQSTGGAGILSVKREDRACWSTLKEGKPMSKGSTG